MRITNLSGGPSPDKSAVPKDKRLVDDDKIGLGKILVVGLGPGPREYLTPRALAALQQAQVIIGYKTYLSSIRDLLVDKEVISSGKRKETDRARAALELAGKGKVVAVLSSGDPGVFGMGGIVLEIVGDLVPVEIIPGVTAATWAAGALGAPLMDDFAVISLSDLLTPWENIEKRLTLLAIGDFAIVLFNPRSKSRGKQIEAARRLLLKHKDPQTPVGIVRNTRGGQKDIIITTLKDMLNEEIDMKTTVIIGNSQTRVEHGRMLTRGGYSF